jgi:fumarate reductase subunit D
MFLDVRKIDKVRQDHEIQVPVFHIWCYGFVIDFQLL